MKPFDVALAIAFPLIWGFGFTAAKYGVGHFPPIFLTACRFALSVRTLDSSVGSTTSSTARLAASPTASSAATSHPCRPRARRGFTSPSRPPRRRRTRRREPSG